MSELSTKLTVTVSKDGIELETMPEWVTRYETRAGTKLFVCNECYRMAGGHPREISHRTGCSNE